MACIITSLIKLDVFTIIIYDGFIYIIDKLKLGHKGSVTFSAEELHFYEKDEIELKTPHTFLSCLHQKRKMPSLKHKRYLSVTLVIKRFDLVHCFILCGSTQKQLHEDSVGILWDTLKKEFGRCDFPN